MEHKSNIKIAFFLNLSFTVFEIVGGVLTNSIALVSDAIHDLGDSMSLGVSWYLEHVSKKKPTKSFSYGYGRFSLLGALVTSIVLLGGIIFIFIEAIPRLLHPEVVNAQVVLVFAVIGVLVNGYAALKTSHGASINERVISLHLLEDVFGWAVLLVVSVIMSIWNVPILDPILSVLYSFIILIQVLKNLKKVGLIFLQGFDGVIDAETIKRTLMEVEHVQDVHHIHYWTIDGNYNFITLHVLVNFELTNEEHHELLETLKHKLMHLSFQHATIETEYVACHDDNCHPKLEVNHSHHHHH